MSSRKLATELIAVQTTTPLSSRLSMTSELRAERDKWNLKVELDTMNDSEGHMSHPLIEEPSL